MDQQNDKKGFIFNTKWAFSSATVFVASVLALSSIGFVPEAPKTEAHETSREEVAVTTPFVVDAEPTRLLIGAIGVDTVILNPSNPDPQHLDLELTKGVVRYPGSADLAIDGTMFLFGHSSGLPVVVNQNFKVFNRLSDLAWGDLIRVRSGSTENVYRVGSVRHAPASDVTVQLSGTGKRLVISTCDSFGEKSDRIIVEAEFIGSFPVSSE